MIHKEAKSKSPKNRKIPRKSAVDILSRELRQSERTKVGAENEPFYYIILVVCALLVQNLSAKFIQPSVINVHRP